MTEALAASAANGFAKWPKRLVENRLEPECWPNISPGFKLEQGAKIFAIGSCFARNIEYHLERLGFDIPTRRFVRENKDLVSGTREEILNKYTPPSIFQELHWTKRILERDDQVSAEDIQPFLFPLKNGNYFDIQRTFMMKDGLTFDQAFLQRQKFYSLLRQAFSCDILIITLGLIECWWDAKYKQFVEYYPVFRDDPDPNRFFFKRLNFSEAYDYTRQSLDLLDPDGTKRILLTTSPIPLGRTFTSEDVITANCYSKSVLRAVAGQISEERANVDYFPSYESVMLTKQNSVWTGDLRHVDSAFIGRIMARVTGNYAGQPEPESAATSYEEALRFAGLMQENKLDDAQVLYDAMLQDARDTPFIVFQTAAALLAARRGEVERAALHIDNALRLTPELGPGAFGAMFSCAAILELIGRPQEAPTLRMEALELIRPFPVSIKSMITGFLNAGKKAEALAIMRFVEDELSHNSDLMHLVLHSYQQLEQYGDVERIWLAISEDQDTDPEAMRKFGNFLASRGKMPEAFVQWERALEIQPDSLASLRQLSWEYLKANRYSDAIRLADRLVKAAPRDVQGFIVASRALLLSKQPGKALAAAEAALRLAPDNERCIKLLQIIKAAIAKRENVA